jgi:hypothetical protein
MPSSPVANRVIDWLDGWAQWQWFAEVRKQGYL